ncbi:MAG: energy transducer TonB [Saonia sp.]
MNKNTAKSVDSHGNGKNSETTERTHRKGSKYDANLRKRGFIRFQIGLLLAMILVYAALEASFKAYDTDVPEIMEIEPTLIEYHPELNKFKVEKKKLVAPKKIVNPSKFIIDEDEGNVDPGEDVILEVEPEEGTIGLDAIAYVDPDDDAPLTVLIDFLDEMPIFPGCENVDQSQRKACFQEKLQEHILKNFEYPEAAQTLHIQGRVNVTFKIDTDGSVNTIQMRGPHNILEKEAARIIGKLPKMTPGKQKGRAVRVPYSIPIYFQLRN